MDNLQGGEIALTHVYEVTRRVARLGYATLYEGVQDPFSKPIWLSVYDEAAEAGADGEVLERLRLSVQAVSQLYVTGVLRALDFGELAEGVPFVVSERVDAPSLREVLDEEGTLEPEDVVVLITRLASALEALHVEGRAHGQVHPDWIFLPDGDCARAMLGCPELGLSLAEIRAMPHALHHHDALAPQPPDAFRHERERPEPGASPATPDDDLYALGAVAYECCVGLHPYFSPDVDPHDATLHLLQRDAQSLFEQGLDEALSDLVDRAIAAEPDDRWPSPDAFARALREWMGEEVGAASPAPRAEVRTPEAPAPAANTPTTETPARLRLDELPPEQRTPQPSRADTVAALAILLLVVSNIAWCSRHAAPLPAPTASVQTTSGQPSPDATTGVSGAQDAGERP